MARVTRFAAATVPHLIPSLIEREALTATGSRHQHRHCTSSSILNHSGSVHNYAGGALDFVIKLVIDPGRLFSKK